MPDINRVIAGKLRGENSLVDAIPIIGDTITDATSEDVAFASGIPAVISFIAASEIPVRVISGNAIFAPIITFVLGLVFIAAKPEHVSVRKLMSSFYTQARRPTEFRAVPDGGDENVIENAPQEVEKSTVELTKIEAIHPAYNAVERADQTLVAAMHVSGTNAPKKSVARSAFNFLNNQLDFPIQIYYTTNQFDPTDFLEKYEERSETKEVADNPVLDMYINSYMERAAARLGSQTYREYYIIIPVEREEIIKDDPNSGVFNIENIPMIGDILAYIFGRRGAELREKQIRERQADEIRKRMNVIQNGLLSEIGSTGRLLDADEYAALLKEYWEGRSIPDRVKDDLIRTRPAIVGEMDNQIAEQAQQED